MSTAEKLITPEELAAMPDGERYELVDGQLLEREMSNFTVHIGRALFLLLWDYSRRHGGEALHEGYSYCCFPHTRRQVRKPDVSWFSAARWTDDLLKTVHLEIPPDLVIEVVSPNDNTYNVRRRVKDFLRAGAREAWVVYPETLEIERRFPNGAAQWYEVDQSLDAAPLLPGFSFKLADVLPKTTP